MKLFLRDHNPQMALAWREAFAEITAADIACASDLRVDISCGDIFDGPKADAIVSPANSFGFMDGGIDGAYTKRFGSRLQEKLQTYIKGMYYGELPVGQAIIVATDDADYRLLISAPTMRVPQFVSSTVNAYLAFRAALLAAVTYNRTFVHEVSGRYKAIESIICPGLGTSIGMMDYATCARQMLAAYETVMLGKRKPFETIGQAMAEQQRLIKGTV